MTGNLGRIDQFLRLQVGMALLAYIVKDGSLTPAWPLPGLLGTVLVVTAFFSYCPLYDVIEPTSRDPDRTDRLI